MQIFIKTNSGKTVTLDVAGTDTIREVKIRLYQKEYPGNSEEDGFVLNTRLIFKGNILKDDDTVAGRLIVKESTLHAVVPPVATRVERDELSEALRITLRTHLKMLIHGLTDKSFIFIGIGSCDGGH